MQLSNIDDTWIRIPYLPCALSIPRSAFRCQWIQMPYLPCVLPISPPVPDHCFPTLMPYRSDPLKSLLSLFRYCQLQGLQLSHINVDGFKQELSLYFADFRLYDRLLFRNLDATFFYPLIIVRITALRYRRRWIQTTSGYPPVCRSSDFPFYVRSLFSGLRAVFFC